MVVLPLHSHVWGKSCVLDLAQGRMRRAGLPLPSSAVTSAQKSSTGFVTIIISLTLASTGFYIYWTSRYEKILRPSSSATVTNVWIDLVDVASAGGSPSIWPSEHWNVATRTPQPPNKLSTAGTETASHSVRTNTTIDSNTRLTTKHSRSTTIALRISNNDGHRHDHHDVSLKACRLVGRDGVLSPELSTVPYEKVLVSKLNKTGLRLGGLWSPKGCRARDKVAIVIPFRKREQHLLIFAKYIHPFLQRQQLQYGIYVIDQAGNSGFNRAMLMNIGFLEALEDVQWNCFAFHDIDHIPIDNGLSYACEDQPVHMAEKVDKWNWGLPYRDFVGGVVKQQRAHTEKMNGFANFFWGWGGEDDDILVRWRNAQLLFKRPGGTGRYATIQIHHSRSSPPNPNRFKMLKQSGARLKYDGLNSVQYHVIEKKRHPLYTKISVRVKHTP